MLNPMDRLTYQIPWRYEEGGPDSALGGVYGYSTNCSPKAIIERLGEYEDTGCTPEEIRQMIQMVNEMDRAVDELESCLEEMKA